MTPSKTADRPQRKPRLKREIVAAKIKNLILENSLREGDPLPTEQELADRFGVSRICVREATKALSLLGILNATRRWGTTIGDGHDMSRFCEYAGLRFAVRDYSLSELLEARLVIEVGVLPAVIERIGEDPAVGQGLQAVMESMAEVLGDSLRAAACDMEFHAALVRTSGNGPLTSFSRILQAFFRQVMVDRISHGTLGRRQEVQRVFREHRGILEALRRPDRALAESLLRTHLQRHKERPPFRDAGAKDAAPTAE